MPTIILSKEMVKLNKQLFEVKIENSMRAPEKTAGKLVCVTRSNSLTQQHKSAKAAVLMNNTNKENVSRFGPYTAATSAVSTSILTLAENKKKEQLPIKIKTLI